MNPREIKGLKHTLTGERLQQLYDRTREVYLADSRPWVIGYSGGKDSTAVLQIVWASLSKLPKEKLTKPVYVISSDTLVETPVIVQHITGTLERINSAAEEQKIPFQAQTVSPLIEESFWVNMIGKGYPAPYQNFRWCTDRMKIKPANVFILEKVAKHGEVIVVLGARRAESASRAQVMNLRKEVGDMLSRHSELPNAWVYTPIEDWETGDVWDFLAMNPSPWGNDNRELITLYRNAQDGECPLVVDKTTPSCGNSRFGCWTCTVVTRDKSMEAMIDNGQEWMEPMLEFRDWLASTQDPANKHLFRESRRRTGHVQYSNDGRLIWGPYKFEFRQQILRRLLEVQKLVRENGPNPNENLILHDELTTIQRIWRAEEADWNNTVAKIYMEILGISLEFPFEDYQTMGKTEMEILKEVCEEFELSPRLIGSLFDVEKRHHGMSRRAAIYDQIDSVLRKDWRTSQELLEEVEVYREKLELGNFQESISAN